MSWLRRVCVFLGSFVLGIGTVIAQRAPAVRKPSSVNSTTIPSSFLPFLPITPCRIADTRGNGFTGAYGPPGLSGGAPRDFQLAGQCGIPFSADAVSLNITVTNTQGPGFILVYPAGAPQPMVSTLNYVAGQTVANAAIVPLGTSGGVTFVAGVSGTDLIIDVNGYFAGNRAGLFDALFLGVGAGTASAGDLNIGIGTEALTSIGSGEANVALGVDALFNDISGGFNTALGTAALFDNLSGGDNVAVGGNALLSVTSGSGNIAIGLGAGNQLTTGNNNIYIGNLGFIGDEQGTIRIGNANHVGTVIAGIAVEAVSGVPVLINGGGRMGVATSSVRFKEDVRDIGEQSDGLMELRPVSFRYKPEVEPSGLRQFGLLAEDVERVYPDLVTFDDQCRPQAIRYQLLVPMLLNEAQKDRRTIASQENRLADQERNLTEQAQHLAAQERNVEELTRRLEALESRGH